MAREIKERGPDDVEQGKPKNSDGLVPVMFAASTKEAEKCLGLLKENEIPASLGDADDERVNTSGIPVLVPGTLLDEASEILAAQDTDDDDTARMSRDEEEEFDDDEYEDDADSDDEDDDYDVDDDDDDVWDDDEGEDEDEV